jgi:hypothetical protein
MLSREKQFKVHERRDYVARFALSTLRMRSREVREADEVEFGWQKQMTDRERQ